ncbi:hypothetical protein [Flavobacterium sp.]|uniref:hypothetical protein n=1 Tax=Flavobacterium sp. TaxID=239 RepID=UPI00286A9CD5|nr:hypothetical protein [Flavobacterium sp.]
MKNTLYLLIAILFATVSCTQNEDSVAKSGQDPSVSAEILPKKVSSTYVGTFYPIVTTYTYNGNKILESVYQNSSASDKTTYTYTGNLITKKASNNTYTDFIYENGKLKTATSYGLTPSNGQLVIISKNKNVYIYNTDGTISKQTYNVDVNTGVEYLDNNGTTVMTLLNGNVIKHVYQSTTNSSTGTTTYTYEYDAKNNPFKNVLGYNELMINSINPSTSPANKNLTRCFLDIIENFTSGPTNRYTETRTHQFLYNDNGFVLEDKEFFEASANSSGVNLKSTTTYTY